MKQIITSLPSRVTEQIIKIERIENQYTVVYKVESGSMEEVSGSENEIVAELKKVFKSTKSSQEEVCDIAINMVCGEYFLDPAKIKMKTRKREIVEARQLAMTLVYNRYRKSRFISLHSIGKTIGGKDHATVIHASKQIANLCDTNKDFKEMFDRMTISFNEMTKYEN